VENVYNPLALIYQTQLEAGRRLSEAIFSGVEKIDRAVMGATRQALADQYRFVQAIVGAGDPRSAGSLQNSLFGQTPGNVVNCQKEISGIMVEMQNEIGRSLQECVEQWRQRMSGRIPGTGDRPIGAELNPITGLFSVWESTFKDVAALARKNMMTASQVAQGSAGYASDAASHALETGGRQVANVAKAAADATGAAMASAGSSNSGHEERKSPPGGKRK
jgi:hypothetical protein